MALLEKVRLGAGFEVSKAHAVPSAFSPLPVCGSRCEF